MTNDLTRNCSNEQIEALAKPCPQCGGELTVIGDLADSEHDLVAHIDSNCDYVMLFDGSTMQEVQND